MILNRYRRDFQMGELEFLYQKLCRQMAQAIKSGRLSAGEKIPSIRKTMRTQGMALITVQRAYHELMDLGLIESHPRSGYRVKAAVLPQLRVPSHPNDLAMIGGVLPQKLEQKVMAQNRNPDLLPLGGAHLASDLLPLRALKRSFQLVLKKSLPLALAYEPVHGVHELKLQLTRRWTKLGATPTDPDSLMITAGATEAISLALRCATKPGDLVAVESPCYFGLLEILRSLGLRVLEIPTDSSTGMRLDVLDDQLHRFDIRAVVVNPNYQNPTGALMPVDHRKKLALISDRLSLAVIELDTMSEMNWNSEWLPPIRSFSKRGHVLSCSSFSKFLGPGLRVGCLSAGNYFSQASGLKRSTSLATASFPQLVIAQLMKSGDFELELKRIHRQLNRSVPFFLRLLIQKLPRGCEMSRPQGGYLIWIRLPKEKDGTKIWSDCVRNGFSVSPGEIFSTTGNFKNYLRVNLGLPQNPRTEKAMLRLGSVIRDTSSQGLAGRS